jgi:AcrR family transcriptional regulator
MAVSAPAKKQRQAAVASVKREFIRNAAKKLFAEHGLDVTSVRQIAREAGYTTGAIYFHYESKEELYGDILKESLEQLFERVRAAANACADPLQALAAAFRELVHFYDENPSDLDLSLYLREGTRPRGISAKSNRELNQRLMETLGIYRTKLEEAGVSSAELDMEVAGLFDEMIGLLIAAHTGRLRVIGVDLACMVEHHVRNLELRLKALKPAPRNRNLRGR